MTRILFVFLLFANTVQAAYVFESAPPISSGKLPASAAFYMNILGMKFVLDMPTRVTGLGGSFFGSGSIWAGLISLDDPRGLPTISPFEIRNHVIAETSIFISSGPSTFTTISADLSGAVDVVVPAGVYGILLGSGGYFNLSGSGTAVLPEIYDSANPHNFFYLDEQPPGSRFHYWRHLDPNYFALKKLRFFVIGEPIPEPSSFMLILSCVALSIIPRRVPNSTYFDHR